MAPRSGDWPLLSETLGRLDSGAIAAAQDIIGRGQIPVAAVRSDTPRSTTPERVEVLLAKATRTSFWGDEITAHYTGDQDRRSILGPRSNLESADTGLPWSYGPTDWTIRFRNSRVYWPALVEELEAAGYASAADGDPSYREDGSPPSLRGRKLTQALEQWAKENWGPGYEKLPTVSAC